MMMIIIIERLGLYSKDGIASSKVRPYMAKKETLVLLQDLSDIKEILYCLIIV